LPMTMREFSNNENADTLSQVFSEMKKMIPQNGQLFEAFMENSPAQAWIASEDCTMFYMNKAYRRTFNLGDETLMKQPSIFPTEYLQQYIDNNKKVIRENKPLETHEDGYDQHGNYRVFKVCKFSLGVHSGVALIGGWMVDITDLEYISTRYQYASQATADVIWEWDIRLEQLYMGEGYQQLLGYSNHADLLTLESHVHPEDLPEVKTSLQKLLHSGSAQHWQMEYRYISNDGTIKHVLNKAFVVRDKNGHPQRLVGALQNVTEIRELQRELINKQVQHHRALLKAVLNTQEKERTKVGTELHDNVNQLLAAAKLMMGVGLQQPDKAKVMFEQSTRILEEAISEIRGISHTLTSPELTTDFSHSIARLAEMLHNSGIKVTLDLPDCREIDAEIRLNLYRIAQEQTHNIIKHAKADEVYIKLKEIRNGWKFTISDNGIGFDPARKNAGTGISNMKSRAQLLGGVFNIRTGYNQGCTITVDVPSV
jgi:PAS domain S-box-containing protein